LGISRCKRGRLYNTGRRVYQTGEVKHSKVFTQSAYHRWQCATTGRQDARIAASWDRQLWKSDR
jgi:hypothetical protein